jgi:hypothetical protein
MVELVQKGLIVLNTAVAVAASYCSWREWLRHQATRNALYVAKAEASWTAAELIALRRTHESVLGHAGLMAKRNKLLAVELAIGDGTKKTVVWRDRKPEVFQP